MDFDWNFGGIPEELTMEDEAAFSIIPVPFEKTTSYGHGTALGPKAIVEASRFVELFDEVYEREPYLRGIWTSQPLEFGNETIEASIHHIHRRAREIFEKPGFPVFLGGEHSVSYPIVQACRERYPDLVVLQFDAHADLRVEYEGTIYSHASVMRRIVDLCPAIQVGIRALSVEEHDEIPSLPTTMVYAHEYFRDPGRAVEKILENLGGHVYISFDIDGFDPSLVPSTGTPEPGGLFWMDAMNILEAVYRHSNVVGADVVELAPVDGSPSSDFTAAKLVHKLLVLKDRFGSEHN